MIPQRLEITSNVRFFDGPQKDTPFAVPQLTGVDNVWWEAWPVDPCRTRPTQEGNPGGAPGVAATYDRDLIRFPTEQANDWFFMFAAGRDRNGRATSNLKNTAGSIKFSGQVYYYDGLTLQNLRRFGFRPGSVLTGAGALYSYRLGPAGNEGAVQRFLAGYRNSSGPVPHELTAIWNPDNNFGFTRLETVPEAPRP
jgi:hypothetical protein